jgi:hypothetical protein
MYIVLCWIRTNVVLPTGWHWIVAVVRLLATHCSFYRVIHFSSPRRRLTLMNHLKLAGRKYIDLEL